MILLSLVKSIMSWLYIFWLILDGIYWLCIYFWKENFVIEIDLYLICRFDDLIDKLEMLNFVSEGLYMV